MSSKQSKKYYAIHLNAGRDINGNPRRSWIVFDDLGNYAGKVMESYAGEAHLRERFPNAIVLAEVPTSPGYHRQFDPEGIAQGLAEEASEEVED